MDNKIVKTALWIKGHIERNDGGDIDIEDVYDKFIEFIESNDMVFSGIVRHMNDDEVLKYIN